MNYSLIREYWFDSQNKDKWFDATKEDDEEIAELFFLI